MAGVGPQRPCHGCGRLAAIVSRRSGRSLCARCYRQPMRRCGRCGRIAEIAQRAGAGDPDICVNCYRLPVATCGHCGRERPCNFVAEGRPICKGCSPRAAVPCAHCGASRPPTARWPEGPVCDPCYGAALRRRGVCAGCGAQRRLVSPPGPAAARCCDCAGLAPMHVCSACGIEDKLFEQGRCARCALARRADDLLTGADGTVPAALVPLRDAIVASASPRKAFNWLRNGAGAPILAEIAAGAIALSHEALDAQPRSRAADYVRQMLVAHGALAVRDEPLARLERWVDDTTASIERPEDRKVVRAFATWKTLRGVRRRAGHTGPPTATRHARNQVIAAVRFLDWLAARHLTLEHCRQDHVELWLATGGPSRYDVRHFTAWATQRHLAGKLTVPALPQATGWALDAEERWTIIRRLLHDHDLELADRVAGSLVLLYAQPLSRIAAMTTDQISEHDGDVSVRIGRYDVTLPQPLAGLLRDLAATGRAHHVGIGATPTTWLFPGLLPGRPITAHRLGDRLGQLGIEARAGRRAALLQLAAQVPAAVLADMLGITANTAVDWVRAAGGDWANYAGATAQNQHPGPGQEPQPMQH